MCQAGDSSRNLNGAQNLEAENSRRPGMKDGQSAHLVWMPTLIRILPPPDCSHNIDRLLRVPRGLEPIPGKARPCQTHGGASLTSVSLWQRAQTCYIKDLACSWSLSSNTQPRVHAFESGRETSEANPALSGQRECYVKSGMERPRRLVAGNDRQATWQPAI